MENKRILAATDFSECGNFAMRRAAQLCAQSGASLQLVHALPGAEVTWTLLRYSGNEAESSLADAARTLLGAFAEEFRARLNLTVDMHIGTGAAHRVIREAAQAFEPEMLVVGAHGAGLSGQTLLGGTAGKLIHLTGLPLLLARLPDDQSYRNVIAAIDLGPRSAAVLEAARALAPTATIRAVHAFRAPYQTPLRVSGVDKAQLELYRQEERDAARQRLADLLGASDQLMPEIVDGHPTSVLLALAQAGQADLIVVARHNGMHLAEVMLGSVPRLLAYHAGCDVLLV